MGGKRLWSGLAATSAVVLLLTGCASTVAGSATVGVAPTTSASPTPTTESTPETTSPAPSTGESTTPTEEPPVPGPITGDPDDVATGDASADAEALTAYLLPGFSGPGVDCYTDHVDLAVLDLDPTDGAKDVVDLLYACVEGDSLGSVLAMFSVGLYTDTASQYDGLASCANAAIGEFPEGVEQQFVNLYAEELRSTEDSASAQIADEALLAATDCLAAPEPVTSESVPAPSGTDWVTLVTGDCVVDVPEGLVETVDVVACTDPHGYEVVGTSTDLGPAEDPSAACSQATDAYLRPDLDLSLTVSTLSSTSDGVVTYVCLVSSDGQTFTESLRG